MDIGGQIRDLRVQKNLTQEELGERTDLSKGYISQLEHNQSSPSLETFFDIIEVLGQTPADFFKNQKSTDKFVYRMADQTVVTDDDKGYQLNWLVPESNENEMEPVLLILNKQGEFKTFPPSEAETFAYVMEGTVTLVFGDQTYTAKKGESFYFASTRSHQLKNSGSGAGKVLLVVTLSYL